MAGGFKRKRFSRMSDPIFICDRSGFKYPIREGVMEPGTGYFVHYTESDGQYSMVNHPQNRPYKPRPRRPDMLAKWARPNYPDLSSFDILTETECFILTEDGNRIEYTDTTLNLGNGR